MFRIYQKYLFIICCIWMLLLIGCNLSDNKNDICETEIQFSPLKIDKKQSDVFSIDSIIHLETNDVSLIGMVSDIIVKPSGFYLVDKDMSNQIVKFDLKGNYLFAINQIGRGPGEFLKLTSFCIDLNDEFIYLYDSQQKKVICYDSKTGKYKREFFIDFFAASFAILPNNKDFIFYFNFTPNENLEMKEGYPQFVIVNEDGDIQDKKLSFDKKICIPNIPYWDNVFTSVDSTMYFFSIFSDVIFAINKENQFKYKYSLNYMNDNMGRIQKLFKKIKKYDGVDFERNRKDRIEAKINQLFKISFTNKYLYFAGDYANQPFFYLYDTGLSETLDLSDLEPDVIGNNLYFNTSDKDNFYLVLPILNLKKELDRERDKFDSKIFEALEESNENDNPLIMKIKMF